MNSTADVPPLQSLVRKAAVDAGFDLEPERDGGWWRLRASGTYGVVWVRSVSRGAGTLLALPLPTQLTELDIPAVDLQAITTTNALSLPLGAAGAVECASPDVLHAALQRVWILRATAPERLRVRLDAEVADAMTAPSILIPTVTEVEAQVRRRVGQDLFRDALLDYWEGRCAVSGLAVKELLRASHAKPWAVATDTERLDVHNGFLLAVHLDALFDRGLLTFEDGGRAVASRYLTDPDWTLLGLDPNALRLRFVHPEHLPYLAYHRNNVFLD